MATCELLKKIDFFNLIIPSVPEHLQTILPYLRTSKQIFFDSNEFANFFGFPKRVKN